MIPPRMPYWRRILILAAVALLVGVGCSQSPEAKKKQALERGEQFGKVVFRISQ